MYTKTIWEKLKPIYLTIIKVRQFRIKYSIAAFGEVTSILSLNIIENGLSPLLSEMYYNNGAKLKSNLYIKLRISKGLR